MSDLLRAIELGGKSGNTEAKKIINEGLAANRLDIDELINYKGKRYTPLMMAAKTGNVEMVDFLVRKGANQDVENGHGESALLFAVSAHNQKILGKLTNANPKRLLFTAVRRGWVDTVINLLEANKSLIEAVEAEGNTALHIAARCGGSAMIEALIPFYDVVGIESQNDNGDTPLMMAVRYQRVDAVEVLMKHKAATERAFHLAAHLGAVEMLKTMQQAGVLIDVRYVNGTTPLMTAFRAGQNNAVEWLITKGRADIHACDASGASVLLTACEFNGKNIRYLIHEGADPLQALTAGSVLYHEKLKKGDAPIHAAARLGFLDVLTELARFDSSDVDVNQLTENGNNALMLLAMGQSTDAVAMARILVAKKIDLTAKNNDGKSALTLARENNNVNLAAYLIEIGAQYAELSALLREQRNINDIEAGMIRIKAELTLDVQSLNLPTGLGLLREKSANLFNDILLNNWLEDGEKLMAITSAERLGLIEFRANFFDKSSQANAANFEFMRGNPHFNDLLLRLHSIARADAILSYPLSRVDERHCLDLIFKTPGSDLLAWFRRTDVDIFLEALLGADEYADIVRAFYLACLTDAAAYQKLSANNRSRVLERAIALSSEQQLSESLVSIIRNPAVKERDVLDFLRARMEALPSETRVLGLHADIQAAIVGTRMQAHRSDFTKLTKQSLLTKRLDGSRDNEREVKHFLNKNRSVFKRVPFTFSFLTFKKVESHPQTVRERIEREDQRLNRKFK